MRKYSANRDFRNMLCEDKLLDCQLITSDGEILTCHKAILAARSSIFKAMFTNGSEEAKKSIFKITRFNSKTIQTLLRFAYCFDIANLDEIVAHDLIIAADEYNMNELKNICVENLIASLRPENALRSLIIAENISGTGNLFAECLNVVAG